jgi:hypothetical protein
MDNIDTAFTWAILSLPALAIVLTYLLRSRYNELIALHLAIFWSQLFPYGALWLLNQNSVHFPGWMMLMLASELAIYCGAFLVLARPMRAYIRMVSDAALEVRARMLLLWLALSTGCYVYIFARYGALALIARADVAESAGMPSYLTYLNGLLAVPAWGVVFCCCIRLAYRRFHPLQLAALAYVLMHMAVEGGEGKREFLMVCAVVMLFGRQRPVRVSWRTVAGGVAAACLVLATWSWYEAVRVNFKTALISGRYDSSVEMIEAIVTPAGTKQGSVEMGMQRNLQQRTPPVWLLEQITERPNLAAGAFVSQSIQNAIPSALGDKRFRTEDEVLKDTLDFPEDDYPFTMLSVMQAETSVLAVLLTPLIYLGLFWLSWTVIARWRGRSEMLVLVAIGVAIFEAGEVQTGLSTLWVYLRTLSIYLAGGFVLWHLLPQKQRYLSGNS